MTKQEYLDDLKELLKNWEITGFEYDILVQQAEYSEDYDDL